MEEFKFKGYAISSSIDIKKIYEYLGEEKESIEYKHIILSEKELENILCFQVQNKKVYIFNHGIIVFLNLTLEERKFVLQFLEEIHVTMDTSLYNMYNDDLGIKTDFKKIYLEDISCAYNKNVLFIIASIIAKSISIEKVEKELITLLDNAEEYLNKMQKSKLFLNLKDIGYTGAKIIKFEYQSLRYIEILNRVEQAEGSQLLKELHAYLYEYYELNTRFIEIRNKTSQLRNIFKAYNMLSFSEQNERRDKFQALLLATFPVMAIFLYFL